MSTYLRPTAPLHVRRLVNLGNFTVTAALVYFGLRADFDDPLLKTTALLTLALGAFPIIRWLKRNDDTYPIVEVLLLTTVPFYAVPVLTGHEALREFSDELLIRAALVVIVFQLGCLAGSALSARSYHPDRRFRREWLRTEILPEAKMHFTAYTALLNTLWLFVSTYSTQIPAELTGTLRAVFFGIGIISLFIQGRMWGAGLLPLSLKILFWVNVTVLLVLSLASLVLITGISLLLTAAVGYFSAARRVPWVPIIVLLPIIAVLHNGKAQMRTIYWDRQTPQPRLSELPAYYTQWAEFGLAVPKEEEREEDKNALTYGLMRRASLYHIVCITVDTMPERTPYLAGASYAMIPSQVLPRFLWPNKPSPQSSVRLLAINLGIQTEEATESTSIAFGMLSEAYANFGYFCVGLLGLTFGWLFRRLAISTTDCATLSPAGLLRILCLVWCLSAETTLAMWFSSFYQACIAIGVPLLAWKSFFND